MQIGKYYKRAVDYFSNQEVYPDLIARVLMFFVNTLSPPWRTGNGEKRILKLFLPMIINAIVAVFLLASNIYVDYGTQNNVVITEILTILFCMIRIGLNITYVAVYHTEITDLVQRYIKERKIQQEEKAHQITLKHCKDEFKASLIFALGPYVAALFMILSVIFREFNARNLPVLNFRIVFLTLDNKFLVWLINYLYHAFFLVFSAVPLSSNFSLVFLLMNNTCWHIDQTIHTLKQIKGENSSEMIKSAVKRTYLVLDWFNDVQTRIRFILFMEFSIMALMLCMTFVSVLMSPPGTLSSYVMCSILLAQLFIICLIGNRVIKRIDSLVAAIYDVEWYDLTVSERKSVQLMLMMAQNMQPFNGVFKEANMETFLTILQFAYSLLMFFVSIT